MVNNRKEVERAELHRTIWAIADDLRGSVDGWDFKSYILGMLFYRYISENITAYIKKIEWKRLDDKKASLVNVKLEADMKDKADWPRQMEWMYNTMMELHKIVKPYNGTIRGIK